MSWRTDESPRETAPKLPTVPANVVDRVTLAKWLVETCLVFGAQPSTAYQVAGLVVKQLEKDDERNAASGSPSKEQ